jgi:SHS2 domain-containing protein
MKSGYEVYDHGADIGVRGWGPSLEQAFVQGATAMFSLMIEDMQSVNPGAEVRIEARGYDLESMFVAWLNSLLTEADLHGLILTEFEVQIKENFTLSGTARGESFAALTSGQGVEVKGATFCQAAVYAEDGTWVAQCVVDV